MLLSFLTVTMFACNGGAHLASRLSGLAEAPAWSPTAFVCPSDSIDWLLIGANCACTLAAHLATAAGYRDMRAGMVAFLQLTELPWVYLLDVLALGEPTTASSRVRAVPLSSQGLSLQRCSRASADVSIVVHAVLLL